MHLPEVVRWGLAGILALVGGYVMVMNYAVAVAWYTRRQSSSTAPLFGGLFMAGAMLLCPVAGVRAFAWVPFVLDIGCLPLLVNCVWFNFFVDHKQSHKQ